jgi:chromosome segregation ATPase
MKNKITVTGFLLPTALIFGSISLLYLLFNSASLSDIRTETEKEITRQSELTSSLKSLREQIDPVRQELSDLKTEQARLQDSKKTSLEIIARAEGLSNTIELIRISESAGIKRLDELQKSETKTSTRYESLLKTIADEERKIDALKTQKAQSDSRLSEALSKESAANQRLSALKQTVASKDEELTAMITQVRQELSDLKSEQIKLQDSKKKSLEIIIHAEGLSNAIEQIRVSESAAIKRLDELQKSEIKTSTRYDSLLKAIADEERNLELFKTQKTQSEARLLEYLSKESVANQRLSSLKQTTASKDEELTAMTTQAQRLRTENADLTAKTALSRQELRTTEAQIREKESFRQELERAVADLITKKATAEAENKK